MLFFGDLCQTQVPVPPAIRAGFYKVQSHRGLDSARVYVKTTTTCRLDSAVAVDGERGSGAALRRRERRLLAWQRHVRTVMQLALAEKSHHSAGNVEQDDALRRQRKRAGREETEHVTHFGLQALMGLPPGMRPGSLSDPRPLRSDRTVLCFCSGAAVVGSRRFSGPRCSCLTGACFA